MFRIKMPEGVDTLSTNTVTLFNRDGYAYHENRDELVKAKETFSLQSEVENEDGTEPEPEPVVTPEPEPEPEPEPVVNTSPVKGGDTTTEES